MAQQIKLKRSAIAGKVPSTGSLSTGELAINTVDGKVYFKRDDDTIQTIVTTNAVITGSLNINGSITGSDVRIDQWGSVSASLSSISSQAAVVPTLQQVTTQGNTTTTSITAASFTGSLFGTASYATQALSASQAQNTVLASYALSASYALTASHAANLTISGSLTVRGTAAVVQEGILLTGTTSLTIKSLSTGSYEGAFLDYVLSSTSNKRAGTLTSVWTSANIEWKDVSTLDIGSTEGAEFTPTLAGSNANIVLAVPAGTWTVRGHLRYM